jgi:hypothetical protein
MKQQGKFVLLTLEEFKIWLESKKVTRTIKLIQQHHTAIPNYRMFTGSNHFDMLISMENAHIQRGFAGIAQNFTTFPDSMIAVCRDINTSPAGIKGANTGGVCIEHVGCFDKIFYAKTGSLPGDSLTMSHKNTIITVNALLCKKFTLKPSTSSIVYHSWYNLDTGVRDNDDGSKSGDKQHKTCPGNSNFFSGNTAEAANDNFIPPIVEKLKTV